MSNLELDGAVRASVWLKNRTKKVNRVGAQIAQAQDVVRRKLEELLVAIQVEADLRAAVDMEALAIRALVARFGNSASPVVLPLLEDYAGPVCRAVDGMRPPVGRVLVDRAERLRAALDQKTKERDQELSRLRTELAEACADRKKLKNFPPEVRAILEIPK